MFENPRICAYAPNDRVGRGLAPAAVGEHCIITVTRWLDDVYFHHSSAVNGNIIPIEKYDSKNSSTGNIIDAICGGSKPPPYAISITKWRREAIRGKYAACPARYTTKHDTTYIIQ